MHTVLIGIFSGALVTANALASQDAASPEALAAYQEGMRLFDATTPSQLGAKPVLVPSTITDYSAVEKPFNEAARLGLAHADYGLACAIYASGDRDRYPAALQHAQIGARRGMLEAKALLISYFGTGVGTPADYDKSKAALEDLYYIVHGPNWPVVNGTPGTMPIEESREKLEELIKSVLENGKCGPKALWGVPLRDFGPPQSTMPTQKSPSRLPATKTAN